MIQAEYTVRKLLQCVMVVAVVGIIDHNLSTIGAQENMRRAHCGYAEDHHVRRHQVTLERRKNNYVNNIDRKGYLRISILFGEICDGKL